MKRVFLLGVMVLLWLTACAAANNPNESASNDPTKPIVTVYKSAT